LQGRYSKRGISQRPWSGEPSIPPTIPVDHGSLVFTFPILSWAVPVKSLWPLPGSLERGTISVSSPQIDELIEMGEEGIGKKDDR